MPNPVKDEAIELLALYREGKQRGPYTIIKMLQDVIPQLPDDVPPTPPVDVPVGKGKVEVIQTPSPRRQVELRKEATPVRLNVRNWNQFAPCKRCNEKGVKDGDTIVKIYGVGWFHDACYEIINPDYYAGLAR